MLHPETGRSAAGAFPIGRALELLRPHPAASRAGAAASQCRSLAWLDGTETLARLKPPNSGGRMEPQERALPAASLCLLALLALPGAARVAVEETYVELDFFQESLPSQAQSGEFLQEFDGEETFHVDLDQRRTVWRLPDFETFTSFDAQGALANLAVTKNNLGLLVKRSNRSQAQDVAPTAVVYPKNPVGLGDPNVLICFVDQFSPPVLNITWLKNGEVVSQGVEETAFYHNMDNSFQKFSYLPFIPEPGDSYVCRVDHWGLPESLNKIWYAKEPPPIPETMENVVCALGLVLGILGIVVGTTLCFKARQRDEGSHRRGPR